MRSLATALLPLLAGACAAPQLDEPPREFDTATQAERVGDFHLLLGVREFDDEGWDDLDGQPSVGVIWSAEAADSWIGWEAGLLGSWDEATVRTPNGPKSKVELEVATVDGSIGLVKSMLVGGRFRPYVGAGGALLYVEYETTDDGSSEVLEDDDVVFGGYARAGLLFQVTDSSHIGLDFRAFRGPSGSVAGVGYDTDYEQIAFVFGASF